MNLSQATIDRIATAVVDELFRRGANLITPRLDPPGWGPDAEEKRRSDVSSDVQDLFAEIRERSRLEESVRTASTDRGRARAVAALDRFKEMRKARLKTRREEQARWAREHPQPPEVLEPFEQQRWDAHHAYDRASTKLLRAIKRATGDDRTRLEAEFRELKARRKEQLRAWWAEKKRREGKR